MEYPEVKCDECGGKGHDIGALNGPIPWECAEFEPCLRCNGSGREPEYEIGERIAFRDDTPERTERHATITGRSPVSGWYEVKVDGVDDDLPSIHPALIICQIQESK